MEEKFALTWREYILMAGRVLAEVIDRKQVNSTLCGLVFCGRVNVLLHKYYSYVDQAVERVT
jgi:hypothetical protein